MSSLNARFMEMSFVLAHLETTLVSFNNASHAKTQADIHGLAMSPQKRMPNSAFIRTVGTKLPVHSFDDFHENIRSKFLQHCRTESPIEHFTLLIATQNITRLRLTDHFMVKQQHGGAPSRDTTDKTLLDLATRS